MTIYQLLFTGKVDFYAEVKANSPEEAAKIGLRDYAKRRFVVSLKLDYLDTKENAKLDEELKIEFVGQCCRCKRPILSDHRNPDTGWIYTGEDDGGAGVVCRPCALGPVDALADLDKPKTDG